MRWLTLLAVAAGLSACANGMEPETSSDGDEGGAGWGGAGSGGLQTTGGGGPACDRWVLEAYGPGADGKLGTADDALTGQRSVQIVNAENVIEEERIYSGPGPDGTWDTPDDVIQYDQRTVPADGGAIFYVGYDGPGPDGTWGNDDDSIQGLYWSMLDASGRPVETRSFNGPGIDGKWMSGDEPVERRHTFTYGDGQSTPTLLDLESVEPGPDQAWGTGDDPVAGATRRFPEWGTFSMEPGPDGAWGTADDPIVDRYEDKKNWQGWLQWLAAYGSGIDGVYLTPDDPIQALATSKCLDAARDVRLASSPGLDQQWGTDDDDLQAHMRVTGCADPCGSDLPSSPLGPK